MELRFDAILYSKLANENFDASHIKCSPTPGFEVCEAVISLRLRQRHQ